MRQRGGNEQLVMKNTTAKNTKDRPRLIHPSFYSKAGSKAFSLQNKSIYRIDLSLIFGVFPPSCGITESNSFVFAVGFRKKNAASGKSYGRHPVIWL
jgi:hypothetical protein